MNRSLLTLFVFAFAHAATPPLEATPPINVDGSELERITYTKGFDGFPMFSTECRSR